MEEVKQLGLGFESPKATAMRTARKRRDQGMQAASQHAEATVPGWVDLAYAALEMYVNQHSGPFLIEQFREWITAGGIVNLAKPPDARRPRLGSGH